ncbi:hypothetical protein D3C86_1859710 [compost metagenome]
MITTVSTFLRTTSKVVSYTLETMSSRSASAVINVLDFTSLVTSFSILGLNDNTFSRSDSNRMPSMIACLRFLERYSSKPSIIPRKAVSAVLGI